MDKTKSRYLTLLNFNIMSIDEVEGVLEFFLDSLFSLTLMYKRQGNCG
jgi:hypothetical protein